MPVEQYRNEHELDRELDADSAANPEDPGKEFSSEK